jgi:hypothetical protein
VVAVCTPAAAAALKTAFPEPDFYLDEAAVRDAIAARGIQPHRRPRGRQGRFLAMKLRWAQILGGSEKQFVDGLRVYEVQHGRLDETYLDRWAATLGVSDALRRIRSEAHPIE